MKKNSTNLSLFLRVAISLLLVGILVHKISFSVIVETATVYSLYVIFLAVAIYLLATCVAVLRWKLLLPEYRFNTLFQFTFIGQFYAMVLPGQITGEIAKAYRLSKGSNGNGGQISTSIAVDKIVGLMGVMFVTSVGLLFTDLPERNIWIACIVFLFVSFVTVFKILGNQYAQQKIKLFLSKFELLFLNLKKLFVFIQEMFVGFKEYSSKPKILTASFLLAVLFQILAVLILIVFALALGIHIPIQNYFWIFGMVSLAVTLPITIAGVGIREGLFVYFLLQFNVAPELALILSLSVFSLQVLAAGVGGVLELIALYQSHKNQQLLSKM